MLIVFPPPATLAPFAAFAGFAAGAAMTRDAVVEASNALFLVFGTNVRLCVLVATEARVAREVVVCVARRAGRVVLAVQQEEPVVIEGRRLPALRAVALRASGSDLPMQTVRRCRMTTLTSRERGTRERGVVESGGRPMLGRVALVAAHAKASMDGVRGRHVTGRTVAPRRWAQQRMREASLDQAPVIAVTGDAVLFAELLVE